MVANSAIKPIETHYKGYRFRSRLEARWAVFFDALDIEWEYEKEGYDLGEYGWYLPDFWLPIHDRAWPNPGYWIEIKGALSPQEWAVTYRKLHSLTTITKHYSYLICGEIGKSEIYRITYRDPGTWGEYLIEFHLENAKYSVGYYEHMREFYASNEYEITYVLDDIDILRERQKASRSFDWNVYLMTGRSTYAWSGLEGTNGGRVVQGDISKAVAAARSARFEHGETPNTYQRKGRK